VYPSSTNSIQLFDPTPLSMSIASSLVNIVCIVLMVRLLLHSCYSYGLLQEPHPSTSIGMNPSHQCINRVAHMPYQCQMYQIIPLDSADINHDRPPYLTCMAGTIWPPVLSHMLYQWNEGRPKIAELIRHTTYSGLAYRYYPPDASV